MSSHNKKTILITGLLALVFGLGSIILTPSSQANQQANIFQSIRNFFSFNRERPQPQPEHLFEEESIKAFQEKLFDPTIIHLKLTQEAVQVYIFPIGFT